MQTVLGPVQDNINGFAFGQVQDSLSAMNSNLPPKIDEAPRKSSQSSFLLGGLVGLVAGVVLASLVLGGGGNAGFPQVQSSVQPAPSCFGSTRPTQRYYDRSRPLDSSWNRCRQPIEL